MAEKDVKLTITGDSTGLLKALADSSKGVENFAKDVQTGVAGLQKMLLGFTAIFGGFGFLKGTVDETKNWTVEAQKLARVLGITTEKASALNLAIGDIYGTQEEYLGAVAKLTKTLNKGEEAFHRLGVATRDQNGRLRDTPSIMADVNKKLMEMKSGTDRNVASAQIYGKSWMEVQRYLKLTPEVMAEAQAKAERLNLIVGQDAVEATNQYRASMNELEDTVKALKIRIGQELMPVMTEFNNAAAERGPEALSALGVAINLIVTGFKAVTFAVEAVIQTIVTLGMSSGRLLGGVWEALGWVEKGQFGQAKEAIKRGYQEAGREMDAGNAVIHKSFEKMGMDLNLLWDPSLRPKKRATQPDKGGKAAPDSKSDPDKEFEQLKSRAERYKYYIEASAQERGEYREATKAQEAAFWKSVLGKDDLSEKTRFKAQQEYYKAARAELKKHHDEERQLDDTYRERYVAEQKALLDEETAVLENQLKTGRITEQQALDWKRGIEREKYDLELAALNDRLAVKGLEPVELAKIHGQIEALEAQHNLKVREFGFQQQGLDRQGNGPAGGLQALQDLFTQAQNRFEQWRSIVTEIVSGVGNVFSSTMNGILTGQIQGANILKSIYVGLGNVMASAISKIIGEKIKEWVVDRAISAWKTANAAKETTEATTVTAANTSSAASGIFKAHAGIPWVGVAIAIAMIALMMATMKSITARAVGGRVDRPEFALIGEAGPEIIAPERSFADYTRGILGLGANLGANLGAYDAQISGYGQASSRYASATRGRAMGGGGDTFQLSFPGMQVWDRSDRGQEQFGNWAIDAIQVAARRRGQIIAPSSAGLSF